MLYGNQLEVAFRKNGIQNKIKRKTPKHKQFKCHKCGQNMIFVDNTNIMACECGQYFVFSNGS